MENKVIKLNLGCRNILLEGYINIDLMTPKFSPIYHYIQADVMDIDRYFAAKTVDEVYSSHFIEHLTMADATYLFFKIWVLLRYKGRFVFCVPDIEAIIEHAKKFVEGDFVGLDLLHSRVFETDDMTRHKTVWFKDMGIYYLQREGYFKVVDVRKDGYSLWFDCIRI